MAGFQFGIWNSKNSPYLVVDDIIVPKGLVLKIEPGVVVQFAGQYQIIVEGSLIAKGSEARPIIFTSLHDPQLANPSLGSFRSARPSDWRGIEFRDSCDDYLTALDHCIIRFSEWGIRCVESYPLLTNLILQHNEHLTLTINGQDVPYLPGRGISPISSQTKPRIAPLPEPQSIIPDGAIEKTNQMKKVQQKK
ncbi:MAG: hypothetical protein ONB13_05845 [candidate division KSB1 bacterium]|nr:hypothetical protein [candidate division KSB1 bacterium]MDZ7335357.1 hypothetical protein [candidate division KSB1 bacterium]MDZ7358543.1 hypothetical protein [candidate division KSB1 bacterium]MDZ7376123.1 hypothetical protein [candidate division KSB1 bacterium]MDZ7401516.1 hypothetical protein [candidate division KSB1 bacterium]